jgi:hypothetical protein
MWTFIIFSFSQVTIRTALLVELRKEHSSRTGKAHMGARMAKTKAFIVTLRREPSPAAEEYFVLGVDRRSAVRPARRISKAQYAVILEVIRQEALNRAVPLRCHTFQSRLKHLHAHLRCRPRQHFERQPLRRLGRSTHRTGRLEDRRHQDFRRPARSGERGSAAKSRRLSRGDELAFPFKAVATICSAVLWRAACCGQWWMPGN